ncbi:hypothetical protein D0T84_17495 [Dysgonomonas sp. 521]|nr:hypothetical protein [Dysgonomonas sp. 521]
MKPKIRAEIIKAFSLSLKTLGHRPAKIAKLRNHCLKDRTVYILPFVQFVNCIKRSKYMTKIIQTRFGDDVGAVACPCPLVIVYGHPQGDAPTAGYKILSCT